ncbi:preprotein translocase subunit SecE [bacterium]|nr:preprotein translocase subunit SecE [bacterium]
MMNGSDKKQNETIESIKAYFKGVKAEWGRISWPERRQIVAETLSVIVIVFVFTVAIYCMDLIFKGLLSLVNKI